jgi:hypothetical protein
MTSQSLAEQNVVWTRGKGCLELAEILSTHEPDRIQGDLFRGCLDHRADFVVAKKMPGSFELANVAVPVDFDPERITRVSATVAGGPHSELAMNTAAHISNVLGVPLEIVSAHQDADGLGDAMRIVALYGERFPGADRRVVQAQDMNELADTAEDGALMVVGAPGGSWLRRSRSNRRQTGCTDSWASRCMSLLFSRLQTPSSSTPKASSRSLKRGCSSVWCGAKISVAKATIRWRV